VIINYIFNFEEIKDIVYDHDQANDVDQEIVLDNEFDENIKDYEDILCEEESELRKQKLEEGIWDKETKLVFEQETKKDENKEIRFRKNYKFSNQKTGSNTIS
jgi:serine phosphatase RsbU (regulator of sigma subunit)